MHSPFTNFAAALVLALSATAFAINVEAAASDPILAGFAESAKASTPGFTGFSAERGKRLFLSKQTSGKPETPSCTTCHGNSPQSRGQTRADKPIEPMALSLTPNRYSDPKKVAKWFRRNCKSVLGRECTALEKGDFITFMATQ